MQKTPETMWPPAKREMRLMRPAEPEEGMPTNLCGEGMLSEKV